LKLKQKKKFLYIPFFSETTIIPEDRKKIFKKHDFQKFIENGVIERKMTKDLKVAVLLNEKEACIMFPTKDEEVDMGEMLFSAEPEFHEWCLDYFKHCWQKAGSFQESKLA